MNPSQQDLPVLIGTRSATRVPDGELIGYHISWQCPCCDRYRDMDIEIGEVGPWQWCCPYAADQRCYRIEEEPAPERLLTDEQIRPAVSGDRAALRALLRETMGQVEADIVDALWDADALRLCLVAELEGKIVGVVACSPGTASGFDLLVGLGPICVRNDLQRRGIGSQLMDAAIAAISCDSRAILLLGSPAYYSRFQFEPAIHYNLRYVGPQFDGPFQILPTMTMNKPASVRLFHYHPDFQKVVDAAESAAKGA